MTTIWLVILYSYSVGNVSGNKYAYLEIPSINSNRVEILVQIYTNSQWSSSACPSSTTVRLDDLALATLPPLVHPPMTTMALL